MGAFWGHDGSFLAVQRTWQQGGWWCGGALLQYKCWEDGSPKPAQVIRPSTFFSVCVYIYYSSNGINWLSLLSDLRLRYSHSILSDKITFYFLLFPQEGLPSLSAYLCSFSSVL